MRGSVTTRQLAVMFTAGGAALLGVAGCASTASTCAVRNGYAVVVFENGIGANSNLYVTRFRLNIRYGPQSTAHYLIRQRITLRPAKGSNPRMVVRTYLVGGARGCSVDRVRTRW
ncbi:MAG: hypothetical protein M0030_22315 [Actinomycetota bacterium]|nr:hypothetical protein [Actinomycetota bacterium]